MIYAGYKKRPLGDEQYTPRHAVLPIVKYLPRNAVRSEDHTSELQHNNQSRMPSSA